MQSGKRGNNRKRVAEKPLEMISPDELNVPRKTAKYMIVQCANCKDERYKTKSRGGWRDGGLYACVEPWCQICSGQTLIICYGCNKYSKMVGTVCYGCQAELVCEPHEWKEDGNEFKCYYCGLIGRAEPSKKECKHRFVNLGGSVQCANCHCKAEIKI